MSIYRVENGVLVKYSGSIQADESLSLESKNAVQNKIVSAALNNKADTISYDKASSKLKLMRGDTLLSETEVGAGAEIEKNIGDASKLDGIGDDICSAIANLNERLNKGTSTYELDGKNLKITIN